MCIARRQAGFSLVENMVAVSILMLVLMGSMASSALSKSVERVAVLRSAAIRAVGIAVAPVQAKKGQAAQLYAALKAFPKNVYLAETHLTYTVSLAAITDYTGAAVNLNVAPVGNEVMFATFSTSYVERIGGGSRTVSVTPTYVFSF